MATPASDPARHARQVAGDMRELGDQAVMDADVQRAATLYELADMLETAAEIPARPAPPTREECGHRTYGEACDRPAGHRPPHSPDAERDRTRLREYEAAATRLPQVERQLRQVEGELRKARAEFKALQESRRPWWRRNPWRDKRKTQTDRG